MSFDACAAMVERADPDRFAAAMLAPLPERGYLMALYAFNLEVAKGPWMTAEPMIAHMRLQWWRDVIEEIYSGGTVRRHEVVDALHEAVTAGELPRKPFDTIIDARAHDVERNPLTPEAAFSYCQDTSGSLMVLAVKLLGGKGNSRNAALYFGAAQGAANLGVALPVLYQNGWRILDGSPEAKLENDGPNNALVGAIAGLGDEGYRSLLQYQERRKEMPKGAKAAVLAGWQTYRILQAMCHWKKRAIFMERNFEVSEARRRWSILLRGMTGSW